MGIKVLRDAKARPYVAVVNGRIQRVRPKERYWALAKQAEARAAGLPVQASARASHRTGHGPSDDEPPDLGRRPLSWATLRLSGSASDQAA